MKKLMALLLMLCMLVAAVPALGEDYSGMWYMTLAEVNFGTMALNADGSVEFNMMGQDPKTGTWTSEEGKVTITIEGNAADFIYADGALSSDIFPFPLNKEEGKVSMDLLTKMMNGEDFDLPEGMTQEDLLAIAQNFMAEYQKLMEGEDGAETGTAPETTTETSTTGEGEPVTEDAALVVSILKENMILVKDSYSEKLRAFYFAEIQNNTQTAYSVNKGLFNLLDADGNVVAEETYFQSNGSSYLEPGETSFACFRVDVPEGVENPTYKASFEAQVNDWARKDLAVNVTGTEISKDRYDGTVMRVTVENNQEGNLIDLRTVAALEDVDGNLIWVTQGYLNNAELLPGNSIVLLVNIDSDADAYFAENNISPAKVEAYAYEEIRD